MPAAAQIQAITLERAVAYAVDQGLDPAPFFASQGLSPEGPEAGTRVSNALFGAFLVHAARNLDEPHFGLKAGAAFHPSDLGAFGYLLMNAASAGQALAEAERFFAFQQNGGFFRSSREEPGEITIFYDGGDLSESSGRQDAECGIAMIHAINQRLLGGRLAPLLVRFRFPAPTGGAVLERHFGCPVEFECPDNAIVYDAAILTSPVRNADPRLHGILSEFLLQQIADLSDRTDPVAEARWLIRRLMPQARANLKFAAGEMGYSPRTLQRRLHDGNTSFADLLQEVRLEKWREEGRRAPGRKMAATLGFCEESSYHKWKRRQNLK